VWRKGTLAPAWSPRVCDMQPPLGFVADLSRVSFWLVHFVGGPSMPLAPWPVPSTARVSCSQADFASDKLSLGWDHPMNASPPVHKECAGRPGVGPVGPELRRGTHVRTSE